MTRRKLADEPMRRMTVYLPESLAGALAAEAERQRLTVSQVLARRLRPTHRPGEGDERCRHPVGRRIGDRCADCGDLVRSAGR